MGDFSRDTFKLTNVMHQLVTGETVTNPRHYVGVRLQQGVPILDADWNELEDIRKAEVRAMLQYFIGNGVPANNQGFEISGSGADNDFTIGAGIILSEGLLIFNPEVTTYSAQHNASELAPLTTPPGGLDRKDLVYLDVWDEEVGADDTDLNDERIINPGIGIETARRLARRWAVRVAEGVDDLTTLPVPSGHHFMALALLERHAGIAAINDNMVINQRKLGITLADHLKVPIYLRRGTEIIDTQRFSHMLNGLRTTLFSRLKDNTLPYQTAGPDEQRKEALIFMVLQELMHLCQLGENQAQAGSIDNDDALAFLAQLYDEQNHWLDIVEELGNDASVAETFLNEYRDYLEDTGAISGLKAALDDNNLLLAVLAQEDLNAWLSAPIDNLPEGNVDAVYVTAIPYENLTAGETYFFTYDISAFFSTPLDEEDFQIQVNLNSAFGTASADQPVLTFSPPEQQTTIMVTVTPSGGLASADLEVIASTVRNPLLRSTQLPISLELNQPPPIATFYYYTGPRFNLDGRFNIPQNHLTRPQGRNVLFRIRNTSESESRVYNVTGQVVPNVADTTGWTPLTETAVSGSPYTVAAGAESDVLVNIKADAAENVPAVGTTGEVISVATVTIDGSPILVTVTIPFVVGNATS